MNYSVKFGPQGIVSYMGRLRMPRAYTLKIPVSCAYDGVTRWMDNGRINWNKPPSWRVHLRRPALKPPRTNRGVSHGNSSVYNDDIPYVWYCEVCKRYANLGDFARCQECLDSYGNGQTGAIPF